MSLLRKDDAQTESPVVAPKVFFFGFVRRLLLLSPLSWVVLLARVSAWEREREREKRELLKRAFEHHQHQHRAYFIAYLILLSRSFFLYLMNNESFFFQHEKRFFYTRLSTKRGNRVIVYRETKAHDTRHTHTRAHRETHTVDVNIDFFFSRFSLYLK